MALTKEAMANTIEYVRSNKDVDFICVMGDIFDTHRTLKLDHRNVAIDFINALSEIRPTIVIIGNHDRMNNRDYMSDIHPFYGMSDIKNKLYIVSKPRLLRFGSKNIVMFVPYVPPGRFKEAINTCIESLRKNGAISTIHDLSLICAHQEFYGVSYGPVTSKVGDVWPKDYPMVVSGHIHHRHWLQDNIYYTGSLYPITMSEGTDKGIITITYHVATKKMDTKCTRVVEEGKRTLHIKASDDTAVMEMLTLERENTRYIVSGTQDEIAAIKSKIGNKKNINWVPDVTVPNVTVSTGTFDEMLKKRITDEDVAKLLEHILADQ